MTTEAEKVAEMERLIAIMRDPKRCSTTKVRAAIKLMDIADEPT